MAGGRGSRIQSVDNSIPKPLINICGKPVLQWEIESLVSQGYKEVILTVSYMKEQIIDYFGDGGKFGANISYFEEDRPLGNAGALFKLRERGDLETDFLLLNADAIFDIDFNRFVLFHKSHHALVTLFTHPNSHPYDSGLIIADKDHNVVAWLAKEDERPEWYKNRVNAGLHVINPVVLDNCGIKASLVGAEDENGKKVKVDLDRKILKPIAGKGHMYCYDSPEYVKDMGTPERLEQVKRDFATGLVQEKNFKYMQKAVFLDRDGTINKYAGFLRNIDDFELMPGAAEAIRMINASGYLAIVVSNQPVIARGEVTVNELNIIHNKMETLLGTEGAYIDAIYYCPHHPDKGFEGEIAELKIDCDCRKPKPGMLLQAAKDYNIDLSHSWMVGDSWRDVQTGINAGCKTAWITSGGWVDPAEPPNGVSPDVMYKSLKEYVHECIYSIDGKHGIE